jgi:hypothetical protein
VLLRPLPYPHAKQLVQLLHRSGPGGLLSSRPPRDKSGPTDCVAL